MAKKKPCEFCEAESFFEENGADGHNLLAEVYPDALHIAILSYAKNETGETGELTIEIPMNYCPNCGRKLDW